MIAECSCDTCEYADLADDGSVATCKAFPQGIPQIILRGENDHRVSVPGDQGIVYKPRPGVSTGDILGGSTSG